MTQQNPENVQSDGRFVEYRNFRKSKRPSQKALDWLAAKAVGSSKTAAGEFAKKLGLAPELNDKQEGESDVSTDRS